MLGQPLEKVFKRFRLSRLLCRFEKPLLKITRIKYADSRVKFRSQYAVGKQAKEQLNVPHRLTPAVIFFPCRYALTCPKTCPDVPMEFSRMGYR
jgi:hypothetical protein